MRQVMEAKSQANLRRARHERCEAINVFDLNFIFEKYADMPNYVEPLFSPDTLLIASYILSTFMRLRLFRIDLFVSMHQKLIKICFSMQTIIS